MNEYYREKFAKERCKGRSSGNQISYNHGLVWFGRDGQPVPVPHYSHSEKFLPYDLNLHSFTLK